MDTNNYIPPDYIAPKYIAPNLPETGLFAVHVPKNRRDIEPTEHAH